MKLQIRNWESRHFIFNSDTDYLTILSNFGDRNILISLHQKYILIIFVREFDGEFKNKLTYFPYNEDNCSVLFPFISSNVETHLFHCYLKYTSM